MNLVIFKISKEPLDAPSLLTTKESFPDLVDFAHPLTNFVSLIAVIWVKMFEKDTTFQKVTFTVTYTCFVIL